jgi:Ca2+-binding EF-hand superfamily protein
MILKEDVGKVMRTLGQNPTDADVQKMINNTNVIVDQNEKIDFSGFLELMLGAFK